MGTQKTIGLGGVSAVVRPTHGENGASFAHAARTCRGSCGETTGTVARSNGRGRAWDDRLWSG